jgi:hypothetical protein
MIHMPNRPNVAMRLRPFKLRFGHSRLFLLSQSCRSVA